MNSNHLKTKAFYTCALEYGVEAAESFREYHVTNGGISRFTKFEYFLTTILGRKNIRDSELEHLLGEYSRIVKSGLLKCEVSPALEELRSATPDSHWLVVSGSDQSELRELFESRGLAQYFDRGIFGSPHNKYSIVDREISSGNIVFPAVFFGDSLYDHKVAKNFDIDFVFVSDWSDVPSGQYIDLSAQIPNLSHLLSNE